MRITPLDVHEQTFRIAFRGFDPAEVDAFLQRVADELERLTEERDQAQALAARESTARGHLEETLASARTLQQGLLQQARQEAELLVAQAKLRADRILARANEELVSLRREAQTLNEKRALWLGELAALGGTLQEWAEHKNRQPFVTLELIHNGAEEPAPAGDVDHDPQARLVDAVHEVDDGAPAAAPPDAAD